MSRVRLTDEEIQKLVECIQAGAEVPEGLLPNFLQASLRITSSRDI